MKHIVKTTNINKALSLPLAIGTLFVVLAGRIAFTRPFPLPFDESFHFGLIKLYTHHLNPFLNAQPKGADAFGAVARDPSYLYHYLLSFPLRLLQAMGLSEHAQILALRSLNMLFALFTLYLVYRLALRLGLSKTMAWLPSLALAITPVFYELSAEINYDNLIISLTLLTLLTVLSIRDELRNDVISVPKLFLLSSLILLASLVKYSFLPIAFIVAIYVVMVSTKHFGVKDLLWKLQYGFRSMPSLTKALLISLVAVSGLLWYQRDGMNLVLYRTPHPQCHVVMSAVQCSNYGSWSRNYALATSVAARPFERNQVVPYTKMWLHTMFIQLFGNFYGKPGALGFTSYVEYRRLAKIIICIGGVLSVGLIGYLKRYKYTSTIVPILIIVAAYLIALWVQNLSDYLHLHAPVAIQGRYLLPVLPLGYIFIVASYENGFKRIMTLMSTLRVQSISFIQGQSLRFVTRAADIIIALRRVY